MHKEYKRYLKNSLLIFLIALSFFLVFRLWSVSNYFGDGLAQSISNIARVIKKPFINLFDREDDSSLENLKYVLSPKRIVVNYDEKRSIMQSNEDDFFAFYEHFLEILRKTESGEIKIESVENVSQSDYYASLKSKSVLVDYDTLYDYNLLTAVTDVVGESRLMTDSSVFREIIISMPENVLNYTALYIMDYNDKKVYKYMLNMDKTVLEGLLNTRLAENPSPGTYFYSFELNFHVEENEDGSPAKVLFYPMTSVALMPEERQGIISYKHGLNGEEFENESQILKLFNINTMSAGKYTDIDGSKNFVENNATLKIGADGFIEYISTDEKKGVLLTEISENKSFDVGLATIVTSGFVNEIYNLLENSGNEMLRISGDLTEGDSPGKYTIKYDYYIGGVPVFQLDEKSGEVINSVVARVEDGYLKYYKHYLRTYDYIEEKTVQQTMLAAADELVDKMSVDNSQMKISKAYECFVDSKENLPASDWVFEIEGMDGLYR